RRENLQKRKGTLPEDKMNTNSNQDNWPEPKKFVPYTPG
ncbi:unnamed protein product, partial [marine sediment metagenome]